MDLREGFNAMRKRPMFPLMPFLPLGLLATCVAMNIASYRRLRRLERHLRTLEATDRPRLGEAGRSAALPH